MLLPHSFNRVEGVPSDERCSMPPARFATSPALISRQYNNLRRACIMSFEYVALYTPDVHQAAPRKTCCAGP
jgi:hypothetical protein